MATSFLYINLIFFLSFLLFIFAQFFDKAAYLDFYLLFSLSSIFSILIIFLNFKHLFKKEGSEFSVLLLGYLIYGIANFIWYVFDAFKVEKSFFDILNLMFIFQSISKYYFLIKESEGRVGDTKSSLIIENLLKINLFILLLTLVFNTYLKKYGTFIDIFFVFESLISIGYISFYLSKVDSKFLNYKLFLYGNAFWLIGDLLFSYSNNFNLYIAGDLTDFIYFLGFYLIISSVIFKNYNYTKNIIGSFISNRFLY